MPVTDGVGVSRNTRIKQEHFKSVLKVHLDICNRIFRKNPDYIEPVYYYFDLNAGPGLYIDQHGFFPEEITGSPLVFIKLAQEINIPYRAVFIEVNPVNHKKLLNNIPEDQKEFVDVVLGDHEEMMRQYFRRSSLKRYGLVYSDQTGSIPPFPLLAEMSRISTYAYLDFLIYCSAANIKRVQHQTGKSLIQHLQEINKKFWIIREARDKHQWTFLLGTNWDAMPRFKKLGFHLATSDEGREVMRTLNNVKPKGKPEQALGPTLFDYAAIQNQIATSSAFRFDEEYYTGLEAIRGSYPGATISILPDGHVAVSAGDYNDDKFFMEDEVVEFFVNSTDPAPELTERKYYTGLAVIRRSHPDSIIDLTPEDSVIISEGDVNDSRFLTKDDVMRFAELE